MNEDQGPGVALLLLYFGGRASLVLGTAQYTDVRCSCGKLVMRIPGTWDNVKAVRLEQRADALGVGPIVMCRGCRGYMEVIAQ